MAQLVIMVHSAPLQSIGSDAQEKVVSMQTKAPFSTDTSMGNLGTVAIPHGRDAMRSACTPGVEFSPMLESNP